MTPIDKHFEDLQETGKLPSPSGVGMRILKLTQGDDFSTQEVGQTIMADSALTGRLLKLANSAQSGSLQPIATVAEAIIRLGIRTVRNVALGFSLISGNRSGACPAFDYDRYWARSLGRAVSSQKLSRLIGVGIPAEMYILGLLSEIGNLALASVYPDVYAELLEARGLDARDELVTAEQERFEIDHRSLGARMLAGWGLPDAFASALQRYEGRLAPTWKAEQPLAEMVDVLAAADLLADILVAGPETAPSIWVAYAAQADVLRRRLGLEREDFAQICNGFAAEWLEWSNLLNIPVQQAIDFAQLPDEARRAAERLNGAGEGPPGSGATRVARPGPVVAEARAAAPESASGVHVLAVDDDPMSLRLLERTLHRAGHRVSLARDGEEALRLALEAGPQIVVADWMMPRMDGLELCRTLRKVETGQKIYFLLLTGHGDEGRVVEAFESGVDDYVSKPFNPRILLARIKGGQRIVRLQEQVALEQATTRRQMAELQIMTRRLRSAALTDVLTGLPNRRYAMKRLGQTWESSLRTGNPVSIVMLDIDYFKRVNDQFGHDVGDVVLREVAQVTRGVLREEEDICRLGGEEFLVICPGADATAGVACAERIRTTVEQHQITSGDFSGSVTLSLGVAQRMPWMTSTDEFLKSADEAVYAAKHSGRNRTMLAPGSQPRSKSA